MTETERLEKLQGWIERIYQSVEVEPFEERRARDERSVTSGIRDWQ